MECETSFKTGSQAIQQNVKGSLYGMYCTCILSLINWYQLYYILYHYTQYICIYNVVYMCTFNSSFMQTGTCMHHIPWSTIIALNIGSQFYTNKSTTVINTWFSLWICNKAEKYTLQTHKILLCYTNTTVQDGVKGRMHALYWVNWYSSDNVQSTNWILPSVDRKKGKRVSQDYLKWVYIQVHTCIYK